MSSSIGKNTIYLYIRSFLTLLISLYTSRIILDKLGIDDYGIYNTVGSITTSLSFLTGALGLATSRFLTYDLGKGIEEKLSHTFRCIFTLYLILGIIVVLFFESFGPWFINNKLVFDVSRTTAVNWVFHLSIATVVFSLLMAPFSSMVIAHEKMNFFAYVGVFEAVAKLIICCLIAMTSYDRLIFYAVLLLAISIIQCALYVVYCKRKFRETKLVPLIHKETMLSIGNFASWSLLGQFSVMLRMQGINIITNMFFGPAIVAARAISTQVDGALNTFVSNFMAATNPQIVKRHAAGEEGSSRALVQKTIILAMLLATIICIPVVLNADFILGQWLKRVPDYAVPFTQIILMQSIFATIENGLYSVFYSQGRVKENALVSPTLSIVMFFIVYILFKNGYSPLWLSYCYIICIMLSCLLVKPILIHHLFKYDWSFFRKIYFAILKLIIILTPIMLLHLYFINDTTWLILILETVVIVTYVMAMSYFFVVDDEMRQYFKIIVRRGISILRAMH